MEETAATNGIVDKASSRSVAETLDRVEILVQGKGMKVFARIDQRASAYEAGLSMRPMELLIFGDPRTGTPLMEAFPALAVDLPLKALAWEDASGQVWLSYNDPAYLRARHGLPAGAFEAVNVLIDQALA
jgi:uncharacterized protein (DUF302 family)